MRTIKDELSRVQQWINNDSIGECNRGYSMPQQGDNNVSKEKYLNKEQVAKLFGLSAQTLVNNGFFESLTNHSPLPRYAAYAESEVLAKKSTYLREHEERKANKGQRISEARKGKKFGKRKQTLSPDETEEIMRMFKTFSKKLNKLLQK